MDPSHSGVRAKRRACTNCTTAKVKCTPSSPNICERCQRLRKHCVYLNVSETRRKHRDTARVEKLEERLAELVSELSHINNHQRQRTPSPTSSIARTTSLGKLPSTVPQYTGSPPISVPGSASNPGTNVASWNETVPAPSLLHDDEGTDIIDRGILTMDYARALFDTFRYSYTIHFPFVILPPDTTAECLRRKKPFLFLSIMAAAAVSNPSLQRLLGTEIRQQIATRIIIRNEKNLDLLQGLLVHLAYHHFFFAPENHQTYLIVNLALTLVHELGLNHSARLKKNLDGVPTELGKMGSAERYGQRTTEEIRTFLGIFVLSEEVAKMYRKQNRVCDQDYVIQCSQQLVDANERPSDRWIQRYIQLVILSAQISDTFSYHNLGSSKIMGEGSICVIVDLFKRQLESCKKTIQEDTLEQEAFLWREIQFLDLWIHEVSFHDVLWERPIPGTQTATRTLPPTRLNMLWHCLTVAKACAISFLDVPQAQMFHLPFIAFSKIWYVLIIFFKAVFFHEKNEDRDAFVFAPGTIRPEQPWDVALAARTGEFHLIASAMHQKFVTMITDAVTTNGDRSPMWHFAFFMKGILAAYEHRMNRIEKYNGPSIGIEQEPDRSNSDNNSNHNRDPSSMAACPNIRNNAMTGSINAGRAQPNTNVMDTGSVAVPLDMSASIAPEWIEEISWGAMMDNIMMMPLPSW
ncbi:transcriptional regulator family: Fungal Specific TF [Paecilomyces variotii]|nr:transcriptional regulator family: Fungal Specific TF [Paecilomyces variotii]